MILPFFNEGLKLSKFKMQSIWETLTLSAGFDFDFFAFRDFGFFENELQNTFFIGCIDVLLIDFRRQIHSSSKGTIFYPPF